MKPVLLTTRNFRVLYPLVQNLLKTAPIVDPGTWQSISTAGKPDLQTYEVEDLSLSFPIYSEELDYHRLQIGPNLPWADDHFVKDRVSGLPLNPGHTWRDWPWGNKANSFREHFGVGGEPQFNHTYAERYWPKIAGEMADVCYPEDDWTVKKGIRYNYGDLNDLVDLLVKNPQGRGAYLPVWFPEDTGIVHGGRVPCTLGYLFRMRDRQLSIAYYIRSCDFVRHFQDDVYLTIRLLLWVLDQCRKKDDRWRMVSPGEFLMHIGSMHIFINDHRKMFP